MRVGSSSNSVSRVLVAAGALVFAASPAAMAALPLADLKTEMESGYHQPVAVPLDRDAVFQEVTVLPGGEILAGDSGEPAGPESRLIYSNTLGVHTTNFPANWPVSDDIATTAPDGFNLRSFKFNVLGRVRTTCNGGTNTGNPCLSNAECPGGTCFIGGPYTVKYALYTNCPLAVGSAPSTAHLRELVKIPGTSGEITFPDDGPRAIKHVVDPHNPVTIPTNLYLGLQFNRGNCGTVIGAPAMVGFSGDIWDFPGFPCNGFLGGFPEFPHASFWLEMHGDPACPVSFPGYKAARPSGGTAVLGDDVQGVDDVNLQVDDCQMVGYEVVVRGAGSYTFDLRRQCDGEIIPGTERTFLLDSSTQPKIQVARFTFDTPIPLDDESYFGFRCVATPTSTCGVVLAGIVPILGESASEYYTSSVEGCSPTLPAYGVHGAINLAITCAGAPPIGACCDIGLLECDGGPDVGKRCYSNTVCAGGPDDGDACTSSVYCDSPGVCQAFCAAPGTCEAVCREVSQMNCPWPPLQSGLKPAWAEGAHCEADPFELPCGLAACCKPDDTCENLTKNECAAVPPLDRPRLWQAGSYCVQQGQACPFNACMAREGDCGVMHDWGGCSDPFCCTPVCTADPWCCHVEWDRICIDLVAELCNRPPVNDQCGPAVRPYPGAAELTQSVPYYGSNLQAASSNEDSGFCCNAADPGAKGEGTVWFKFVAMAESAQIDTCASRADGDTLVSVFSVGDPTDGFTACRTLALIGCGDNEGCASADGVSDSLHSRFCVDDLIVGETYYIMLASKSWDTRGSYEIELKMPCQYLQPFNNDDCNNNGTIDGCDLVERTSRDCNSDGLLDACDSDLPDLPDCDNDGVADMCDPFRQRLVSESTTPFLSYQFGSAVAFADEVMLVGDPGHDGVGAVHVYDRDENAWSHSGFIHNPDHLKYSNFGSAVGGAGQRMLVLAGDSDAADSVSGRVFAYSRVGSTWVEEEFPSLVSVTGPRFVESILMDGDWAAIKTSCIAGPDNCDEDVQIHMYRYELDGWVNDGVLPGTGSFNGDSFSFDLSDDTVIVVSKGKYADSIPDSAGVVFVFQRKSSWVETLNFPIEGELAEPTSISFDESLLVIAARFYDWHAMNIVSGFLLYRELGYRWTYAGELITNWDAGAPLPVVRVLSPVSFAITLQDPHPCPEVTVYQRHSDWADYYGYWIPTVQLATTHCGNGPRQLAIQAGPGGVAMGLSVGNADFNPAIPPGTVQYFAYPYADCDGSGANDLCEIQSGILEDCNEDSAPDVCQPREKGDYDLDLRVTLRDVAGLQNCYSGTTYVAPCCGVFDQNGEAGIDPLDVRSFMWAVTGP